MGWGREWRRTKQRENKSDDSYYIFLQMVGNVERSGKWPCGVCNKGVARNSVKCRKCNSWCIKSSGVKGSVTKSFHMYGLFAGSSRPPNKDEESACKDIIFEKVQKIKFTYFTDKNCFSACDLTCG